VKFARLAGAVTLLGDAKAKTFVYIIHTCICRGPNLFKKPMKLLIKVV
jgi:hypothetical protein